MTPCSHHPTLPAAGTCSGCGRSYCQGCLASVLEKPYCEDCGRARLATVSEAPVFTKARRWKTVFWATCLALAAMVVPMGIAVLLPGLSTRANALVVVVLIPFSLLVAGGVIAAVVAQRAALIGNERLRADVAAKLVGFGVPATLLTGPFVGLAVGLERRVYDGETDWDVGFVHLEPGRLLYFGDRTWFGLRPEQIEWVDIDPPSSTGRETRIRCGWRDDQNPEAGVFTISVRDIKSVKESFQHATDLLDRVETWRRLGEHGDSYPLDPPPVAAGGRAISAVVLDLTPIAVARMLAITLFLGFVTLIGGLVAVRLSGVNVPYELLVALAFGVSSVVAYNGEKKRKARERIQ